MTEQRLRPHQGINVGLKKTYIYDNSLITDEVNLAKDWAKKTDGQVQEEGANVDYSAKAYAVGGTGTETNNAKYYAGVASAAASDDNVVAVGTDLQDANSKIKAVANNKTNIDTVAGISTDVTTVSGVASDVSTVATNISDVSAVADDMTDVSAVAGNLTNISAVADNETNINAVNSNKTNINTVAGDKTNIDTVAINVSSVNTVATDISDVNAVATGITDVSTVATNIADVGTVATNISDVNDCATNMADITSASTNAALAKDWANKTGSTVDGSEYSAKYYAQQAASTLANKIDKGYAVNDFATNCITEIPQDIKLELSSGTLTLKSGSIITKPDGTQATVSGDKTTTSSTNGTYMAFPTETGGSIRLQDISNIASGTTDSLAGVADHDWFDTTNSVINRYASDGTTVSNKMALPVGIVTVSGGAISSIDKVFNGIGFIGTAFFALPGTSYLFTDGINTDGTLKSGYKKLTSLVIRNFAVGNNTYTSWLNHNGEFANNYASNVYYNGETNYVVSISTDQRGCIAVNWTQSGGIITDFNVTPVSGLSANYINTALGYTPERAEKPLTTLATSGTVSPATNTYNYIAPTGAVTLSLPASPTATIVNEIELQVRQTSSITFTFGNNVLWGGEGVPDMSVGLWDIVFTWIQGANKWLGSYKKWTSS